MENALCMGWIWGDGEEVLVSSRMLAGITKRWNSRLVGIIFLHGWRKGTAAAAVQCGDKYQVCTRRARNDIQSRAQKPKTNNPERWPRHPDRHMSFDDLRTCHNSMTAVTNVVSGLRRHVVVGGKRALCTESLGPADRPGLV